MTEKKNDNAVQIFFSIYIYIYFILSSKNMVPLFCCQFRGRYSDKFTHGTSVLWEIGEVIEKISTYRFFLNLL